MEVEYKTLTRRELQALCKQHALPANLTNVRMAENLASLLQKKPRSEEIKPKGCLRGSGGSSDEGTGSGRGVPKKVRFYLQEDAEQEGGRRGQDVRASPVRKRSSRRRGIIDCAPTEGSEPAVETEGEFEVKTKSKEYRSASDAVVLSSILEKKNSRKRNHEADVADKIPFPDENNGRKPNMKRAENAPITRALRNSTVTLEESQASEEDEVPRRRQTRRNVKRKEEGVVVSLPDMSLGPKDLENDEDLGNKESSKRRKVEIDAVAANEQNASIVSQFEEPPLRRSKRNLAKSCNVLQGTEELEISSVLEGSDVWKLGNTAEQETEEPVKLPRRSNRAKRVASSIRESDIEASLPSTCETLNRHPKEKAQRKERKSAKNADPFVILPDAMLTAAKDVRKEKLPDVEEHSRRFTRNSSVLNVLEHESSSSNFCKSGLGDELATQNVTRKVERSKKTRKGASDNMATSFTTGDSLQQLAFQADGKALAPSKNILRRSKRNVSTCPSTKIEVLVPAKSSRNEDNKENLPKHTAPELRVSEIAKSSADRVQGGQDLDEPPKLDFSGDCTVVGAGDGIREGDNHIETLKRKQRHDVARRELVIAAEVTVEKSRATKRQGAACLEDDSTIVSVGTYTGLDSAKAPQGNASSDGTKDMLHEKNCEAISDNNVVALGTLSPGLTVILTEELPNLGTCNDITVDVISSKKQSSDVLENSSWNKINGAHQIEKDKNYLHSGVEPVAFLDSHEIPDNVDGFLESAQPSPSADFSVQNLYSKARDSNVSDSSADKVKDLQLSEGCVGSDLIFKHTGDDTTKMVKEDQELCPCNDVEMSCFILNGPCVEDVVNEDITIAGECRESENMTCMKSTIDDKNYSEYRDAQHKETNVIKLCLPEEFSPVADIVASSVSDPQTALMPVNVHGLGEISSYSPICASSLKDEAALCLIPLPGNDLLDLSDQQVVSNNDFDSCKSASSMTSTAESGRNKLHGLEGHSGNTVFSGNLQRHEAAEQEGLFGYSPSNLLTKTFENVVKSSGEKHEKYSENKDSHFLESDALVPHFHTSKVTQDDEIVIPIEGNQNSSTNVTGSSSCNTLTQYDSSEPIAKRREFSPLKLVEISSDIKETSLKVEDAGRAVLGSNFYQIHEIGLSPHVDLVTIKEHTEYSGLNINSEEKSCSDVVGVISMTTSDILNDEVSDTFLQMEGVRELLSEGKSSDTSLKAEYKFEKQVEAQKGVSVMHSKSSASSIVFCEKESIVDISPCVNQSGKNKIMEEVRSPSSIGGTSQLKCIETGSVEKEDAVDTISLCVDNINSSSMYRSSNNGKTSDTFTRKMSNVKPETPGNVFTDDKENHIFSCCLSTSENSSEGKFGCDQSTTLVTDSERKNGEDSTNINNLNSLSQDFEVIDEHININNLNIDFEVILPMEDHQLEIVGPPLCEVLSTGRNLCLANEFSQPKHASCESASQDENGASNEVLSPLPILMENHVMYNGDTTKPNKSENSAALESPLLQFQSPFSESLREMKDVVDHDGVKNGVLDASNGFFSIENEQVKSLSKESNIIIDDRELVLHLDKPLNSPRTHGLCGEFHASYIRETSAWSPDGQDSHKFEDKILSLDHLEASCINERFKFSFAEKNDKDVSMVLRQEIGCMFFEDNEADKTKDMGEEMEMRLGKFVDEEDGQEQLITLCNKSDNHDRNSGSRTFANVEAKLVQSEQNLDINNLIPSNVVSQAAKHQLDGTLDALGPEVGEVSLIAKHSQSEEISKTKASNYIGLNKLWCDNKANEYSITTNGALDAKNGEISISLQQQHDDTDHTDESSEQIDVSQINTNLASMEESEMENSSDSDGAANCNNYNYHNEDRSALESPADGLCGFHSLKKVFGFSAESKQQGAWVAPGAPWMFIEDFFHVETKQSLFAQPVVTGHTSADDSSRHDCGYSRGRSRELNMIEKIEIDSFKSDANVGKEYVEQTKFTTVNDDLKINSDVTVESESENPAGCSDSKSMDRVEHLASRVLYEGSSPKETGSAIEDEDRNSVECSNTVPEKYSAAEERFNEEENADGALEGFSYADKFQHTVAREYMIQDLAVTSELVSIPRALVMVNSNATCEMEKSDKVLAGLDNNASYTSIRSFDVADDTFILGDAFSLPEKQADMNSMDAGAFRSSGASRRTNDTSQTSVRSLDVYVADDTSTALNELESTSILGTCGDTLSDEQSDMNSIEAASFSSLGASVTVNHNTVCEDDMDYSQEFSTGKTGVGSFDLVTDVCTAMNELASTSALGTPGDKLSLPDEQVSTNSIDAKALSSPSASFTAKRSTKYEIEKFDEIVTGKTNDTQQMCVRSFEVAAEADTWTGPDALEPRNVLFTPKDQLVLQDEKVNSISTDAGSLNSPGASSVTMNHSTKCEMQKDQEVIGGNTNATPQPILTSLDLAADTKTSQNKLDSGSVSGTTGEEQERAKSTDVEVINPSSAIVEAVVQEDTSDKVEKLHLATLNMKHLLQKARMAVVASQPILERPKVQSNPECSVSTNDALEPPELSKIFGPKWEDEISRRLLDFRISSARRSATAKPVTIQETPSRLKHYLVNDSVMGKENNSTPAAIRKEDYAHKLRADESTKRSARRPLQSINHN